MISTFSKIIRDEREDRDMNQTEIAIALKTTQRKISRLECGDTEPTTKDIELYCRYFNLSADYILGFTKHKTTFPKE